MIDPATSPTRSPGSGRAGGGMSAGGTPSPRGRALTVWAVAVAVYVVAVTGRTSFGVAGVVAVDRFGVDASKLAVFTSVQVGVYALSQIPVGMLIDRFGPRTLLMAGALLMAAGQLTLGLTTTYPVAIGARVLIGAGDATAFLSVMRLLPAWFNMRRTPLMTQLTSAIGQMGQFLSAVPFLALLTGAGWATAFASLAAVGAIIAAAAFLLVRDSPAGGTAGATAAGTAGAATPRGKLGIGAALGAVVKHPACWQGFFTHWIGMTGANTFALLWGMPLMTLGIGMPTATASSLLVALTVVTVFTSPLMGVISSKASARRDVVGLTVGLFMLACWAIILATDEPRGIAALYVLLLVAMGLTPVANIGFDTIRERVDRRVLATGTGLANMGGFIASMIAAQIIGFVLDHSAGATAWTWPDFRVAFATGLFGVITVGLVGLTVSAWLTRRRPRRRTRLT